MSENYTSSITSRYGHVGEVKKDSGTLNEILERQGSNLLIDVIASYAGQRAIDYKMTGVDRSQLIDSLCNDLKEALLERL